MLPTKENMKWLWEWNDLCYNLKKCLKKQIMFDVPMIICINIMLVAILRDDTINVFITMGRFNHVKMWPA